MKYSIKSKCWRKVNNWAVFDCMSPHCACVEGTIVYWLTFSLLCMQGQIRVCANVCVRVCVCFLWWLIHVNPQCKYVHCVLSVQPDCQTNTTTGSVPPSNMNREECSQLLQHHIRRERWAHALLKLFSKISICVSRWKLYPPFSTLNPPFVKYRQQRLNVLCLKHVKHTTVASTTTRWRCVYKWMTCDWPAEACLKRIYWWTM